MELTQIIRENAQVLWNYHWLDLGLNQADFILALGSHDARVAERAAQLWLAGYASILVVSGSKGKVTQDTATVSEAEHYASIAESMGVPAANILQEDRATNTGDNIKYTCELMTQRGIDVSCGLLVSKPYMRRRAYATAAKQWPNIKWLVSSPEQSFVEYLQEGDPKQTIDLMVGDLQRIDLYAKQGFQIAQDIPDQVWEAYRYLRDHGFDRFVIKSNER